MSQYKVPQNVEAEDHILGYLTFKQLIYAVIGLMWGFLTFSLFRKVIILFLIVGVPPAALFLMLGLIQREGQPFEAYFLALISFLANSRRRIWQKDQTTEFFHISHPVTKATTPAQDPAQVKSQLEHLAQIVDTHGFMTKASEVQEEGTAPTIDLKDRLIAPATGSAIEDNLSSQDDILDLQHNPVAQNLSFLIEKHVADLKQKALTKMHQAPTAAPSTSSLPATPSPDILKLATSGLKVSQVAAQAKKLEA